MRHCQDETRSSRDLGIFRPGNARSAAASLGPDCNSQSVRLSPEDSVRRLLDGRLRHRRGEGGADGRTVLLLGFDRRDLVAGGAFINVDERAKSDPGQLSDLGCT